MRWNRGSFWGTLAVWASLASGSGGEEQWGHLQGRFVYDGEPPKPVRLSITKDEEVCCQHDLVDESLVVDSKSRGLRNVVIYLYPVQEGPVRVHPYFRQKEGQVVELDNEACRFEPRIVLLWRPQALLVGNSDPVGHNALIDTRKNPPVNVTIPSGGQSRHRFSQAEVAPAAVSCSIHPWMRGWVLIRDTPYMAVTDQQGRFEIKNLPVGEWQFACWHERAGFLTDIVRDGQKTKWKRGRVKIPIKRGNNDWGTTMLPAEVMRR